MVVLCGVVSTIPFMFLTVMQDVGVSGGTNIGRGWDVGQVVVVMMPPSLPAHTTTARANHSGSIYHHDTGSSSNAGPCNLV